MAITQHIDEIITKNTAVLDKNDPSKKIGFYFDEWGSWYDPDPGSNPGFLVQRNTLRDALVALKGPLGNAPAFRKAIEGVLADDESRGRVLGELGLNAAAPDA